MQSILFLNFYFGDVTGGSSSSDWFKIGIPILFSVLIVVLQRMWDKHLKQKERILKLYNLNTHIHRILRSEKEFADSYRVLMEKSKVEPFSDSPIEKRITIQDFSRMLDIDKDEIFSAFLSMYPSSTGAKKFLIAYNYIELYQSIHEGIISQYDTISEHIYQEKLLMIKEIIDVDEQYRKLLTSENTKSRKSIWFDALVEIHQIHTKAQANAGMKRETIEFKIINLIKPIFDGMKLYVEDETILNLFVRSKRILVHRDNIIGQTDQLVDFIEENLKIISHSNVKLAEISKELDVKLKRKGFDVLPAADNIE